LDRYDLCWKLTFLDPGKNTTTTSPPDDGAGKNTGKGPADSVALAWSIFTIFPNISQYRPILICASSLYIISIISINFAFQTSFRALWLPSWLINLMQCLLADYSSKYKITVIRINPEDDYKLVETSIKNQNVIRSYCYFVFS
jgi:hypothetical protein